MVKCEASVEVDASFNLSVLRCPDCSEGFAFIPAPNENEAPARYGILQCACFRYPVVDEVPVITKRHIGLYSYTRGEAGSRGPDVEEVSRLVADGRGSDALIRCLAFKPQFEFMDRLPGWRLWHSGAVPALLQSWIERRARRMLSVNRTRLSAEDWFQFYFGEVTAADRSLLPYYRNRFVLPRTLAALSLLRLMPRSDKPVLDLACGFGPFAHYLTNRRNPATVIGADFNFYLAWGQKHWIAPKGTFVCADANHRLPFSDDAFSGVLCSDAFIYFADKPQLLKELNRCAPGKPLLLTRVGNKTASPKEAEALDAEGYMQLLAFGSPRVFSEYALVRHYLGWRNPLESEPSKPADLRWDKWLTFILNSRQLDDAPVGVGDEWPHEVGELAFNPMLARKALADGRQRLWFQFPTIWFAYQNGDMYSYHDDRLECSGDVLLRARSNRADPEIRELIARFVLVGLPERYLKTQLQEAAP